MEPLRDIAKRVPLPRPIRRHLSTEPCAFCERMKVEKRTMFPPHDPSPRCESGKKNHCTCSICF